MSLRTNIDLLQLRQSQQYDRLEKKALSLLYLLLEQKIQTRIEYETTGHSIVNENNLTRNIIENRHGRILQEI